MSSPVGGQRRGISVLSSTSAISFQVGSGNTSNDRIQTSSVDATATGIGINSLSVSSVSGAQSALTALDSAIATVASLRGSLGTTQNRLESTIRTLAVAIENTASAESRIRDVDFASETAELTRNQVLSQAGSSVLAQANLSTQGALTLIT